MNESKKRADGFLREYFTAAGEEPYMLAVLEETDGLKKELGKGTPEFCDLTPGIRARLVTIEAMHRIMDAVGAVLRDEETDVLHGLYRDGLSIEDLAADLNRGRSVIYRIRDRMLDRVSRLLGG